MLLQEIAETGCRIVGAISKDLGHDGPKHHAVVLGRSVVDGQVYVAELMPTGCQVVAYSDFWTRYSPRGEIRMFPNDGASPNLEVAKRALAELRSGPQSYDLIANNCESYVNRAMHGHSTSSQIVNTALGVALLVGIFYVLKDAH